jgi:predicted dehydrogenase
VRFGLVGTGFWAAEVHAAGLARHPAVEFAGVWGRDPMKAGSLADRYGCRSHATVDGLLADVDAVTFAVPPDVQAEVSTQAAHAGRHLLLDKPIALSTAAADRLVAAAEGSGVSTVVFFTGRYHAEVAGWLAAALAKEWHGVHACWLGSLLDEGNPFGSSPWRKQKGGLWDLGPHALAVTVPLLGPVASVAAAASGRDETSHLVLEHERGGWSTLSTSLAVPPAARLFELSAYGPSGWTRMPASSAPPVEAFRAALDQLLALVADKRTDHPCDVRFARDVVRVLAEAERMIEGNIEGNRAGAAPTRSG